MAISSKDIISLTHARARLTDLCDEVERDSTEKIITRNGESCIALIPAERLDHYHRLEREHIHLNLLEETNKGLADLEAGRTITLRQLKSRHGRR